MAKTKKPNKVNADALHVKKSSANTKVQKINPFEVHQNKEKFKILGRTCKHDHGLPGVSRSKALKKRQETLGVEYATHYKTNKFIDKRIGRQHNVITEDLANARFTAHKIDELKRNKKDLFNLNDNEILTHKGQTLAEIERFENSNSDDSGDDEGLDEQYTELAHFGGGGGAGTEDVNNRMDRKTALDDMIVEAKRKKAEIAKDKNEIYNLTNELDENFKNIMPLMSKLVKTNADYRKKGPLEDYDRIMREMIFQPRGAVTDKLQSEEELAKKEKERLERLENERLARMRAEELGEEKPKHRSADDLDDGYLIGNESEEETTLAYDLDGNQPQNNRSTNQLEDENMSDVELEEETEQTNHNTESDDSSENEEDDEEENDNLSDLKVTDSESEEDSNVNQSKTSTNQTNKLELKEDLRNKANEELPYTYEMPINYKEFTELMLEQQHPDYQMVIIERIIKCNHPKLDGGNNRIKMSQLFNYIIEYLCKKFDENDVENIENSFYTLDRFMPQLYDLIQLNPDKISEQIIEIVKEKYAEYLKQRKNYPSLSTVIIFKIISNLFSTSDYRHPVVTPCFIFISHILSKAHVKTRRDISMGLFLATLTLELTQLSHRFLPSVLNFLLGLIFLAISKRPIEITKIIPPFQSTGPFNSLLLLSKQNIIITEEKLTGQDFFIETIDEKYKITVMNTVLKLLKDAIEIIGDDNVGVGLIAEPFTKMLEKLNFNKYPNFVQNNYELLTETLTAVQSKTLYKLAPIVRKPKALRLMEPRIERIYDDKRRPKLSKEKEMRTIMQHKIKRETKGAVREIRRDRDFIQNIKIKKQIASDMERKEKVRQIYAEASVQQGELNELSRQKNQKNKFK